MNWKEDKEVFVADFKYLHHLPGGMEENHGKTLVSGSRFKPRRNS
jgi:hypothetical protein